MTIYESERLIVIVNRTNQNKVTISDKFGGGAISMNRAAFEEMCREVAKKEDERE